MRTRTNTVYHGQPTDTISSFGCGNNITSYAFAESSHVGILPKPAESGAIPTVDLVLGHPPTAPLAKLLLSLATRRPFPRTPHDGNPIVSLSPAAPYLAGYLWEGPPQLSQKGL